MCLAQVLTVQTTAAVMQQVPVLKVAVVEVAHAAVCLCHHVQEVLFLPVGGLSEQGCGAASWAAAALVSQRLAPLEAYNPAFLPPVHWSLEV